MNEYKQEFIVPILKKESGNSEFWGSGFIVDKYLISAAHVFLDKSNYSFIFNNEEIVLDKPVYSRYSKGSNDRVDLEIYPIENLNSPFKLFSDVYPWNSNLLLHGYSMDENNRSMVTNITEVSIKENAYDYESGLKPIRLNIFFNYYPAAKSGNSGCPLLFNNIIYGMNILGFLEKEYHGGNALRSDFIKQIIENLNHT